MVITRTLAFLCCSDWAGPPMRRRRSYRSLIQTDILQCLWESGLLLDRIAGLSPCSRRTLSLSSHCSVSSNWISTSNLWSSEFWLGFPMSFFTWMTLQQKKTHTHTHKQWADQTVPAKSPNPSWGLAKEPSPGPKKTIERKRRRRGEPNPFQHKKRKRHAQNAHAQTWSQQLLKQIRTTCVIVIIPVSWGEAREKNRLAAQ